jgi:hypothetical protein
LLSSASLLWVRLVTALAARDRTASRLPPPSSPGGGE